MKINDKAIEIIEKADKSGYVKITGKTSNETKENILKFFDSILNSNKL